MNILLLGSPYFYQALKELGHDVTWVDTRGEDPYLPTLLAGLSSRPEAIVLTDDLGQRILPLGWEDLDLIKVWYGVDGPINFFWHRYWAALFDLVLADQKACAVELQHSAPAGAFWLPVAIDTNQYAGPPVSKKYDLAFVGTVNESVRPKRSRIIEYLSSRYHMVTSGSRQTGWVPPNHAARLYRQARLVLNENLFPGITTRMLETMASGAVLLTEETESLTDLFTPGQHLVTYNPDNLTDQVDYYLIHREKREKIARHGQELVREFHDIRHRAQRLLELIEQTRTAQRAADAGDYYDQAGKALCMAATRWPRHHSRQRLLTAEKYLLQARHRGVNDQEALFFLGAMAKTKGHEAGARARLGAAVEAGSIPGRIALGLMELNHSSIRAMEHFRAAASQAGVAFPPGLSQGLSAAHHYGLGQILEASGQDMTPGFSRYQLDMVWWQALDHYRHALTKDPEHFPSLISTGHILAKHAAWTEAAVFYSRAVNIKPSDPELTARAIMAAHRGYVGYKDNRKVTVC